MNEEYVISRIKFYADKLSKEKGFKTNYIPKKFNKSDKCRRLLCWLNKYKMLKNTDLDNVEVLQNLGYKTYENEEKERIINKLKLYADKLSKVKGWQQGYIPAKITTEKEFERINFWLKKYRELESTDKNNIEILEILGYKIYKDEEKERIIKKIKLYADKLIITNNWEQGYIDKLKTSNKYVRLLFWLNKYKIITKTEKDFLDTLEFLGYKVNKATALKKRVS
ncbi:hypothetical protein LGK97_08260 [Clostridium sp. CS001]|uniref:hypothetical protein n=1 Tax=Clostridium sp. CS001 TaxID=2880648 RepID=UPI001CF52662|nr:hypothetical protein [Clostridium sp. CS001]MCB2289757.1 hypothetical protein [Clostridium sp. CS001]